MRVSFIATVLNEEDSIVGLIRSILNQSRKADEIIIVDDFSSDSTVSKISEFGKKIKVIVKKGNRSMGRNEAIEKAHGDIIVCSDAGCILDKDWIKYIIEPFKDKSVDVVAGYYKGQAKTAFEKCIIPYFLVMEDRVDENNFLPSTRSMAFRKKIWKEAGKFPEESIEGEDYLFSKELKKIKARIVFQKNAIVYWLPKKSLKESIITFYKFAFSDAKAGIFRPKVGFLFFRYFSAFMLLLIFLTTNMLIFLKTLIVLFIVYIFWSIGKNFKYVKVFAGVYYLPIIQIGSDMAIMFGTIKGYMSL